MKIRIVLLLAVILLAQASMAQRKQVVGYINADKILNDLPQVKEAEKDLLKIKTDYEGYIMKKEQEYNQYLEELKLQLDSLPPLIRDSKIKRLEGLYTELQNFKVEAQKDMMTQEALLFDPWRTKLRTTINDVAKELGYTMVIDNSKGMVLYTDGKDDLEAAVRKKLGL